MKSILFQRGGRGKKEYGQKLIPTKDYVKAAQEKRGWR
jgi:hypothetical protein